MRTITVLAALTAAPVAAALIAVPAHASPAACPAPTRAELKGTDADEPAKGAKALRGVRVRHLPRGFTHGTLTASRRGGVTEYGYVWSDNRDTVDLAHRSLWVRVVCWPKASRLAQLKKLPVGLGAFTGDPETVRLGGRQVLRQEGDGALGHGRYVGWVERKGVVVTVMASGPLVPELADIVRGVKL